MGLFDRLARKQNLDLDPKSALTLAAITMVAADGEIEREELDILHRINRNDDDAFDRAIKVWKVSNFNECVALVNQHLTKDQKLAVMANLLDIAMADGILAGREKELLGTYMETFGLPEEVVGKMVDTISTKNDFSVFD